MRSGYRRMCLTSVSTQRLLCRLGGQLRLQLCRQLHRSRLWDWCKFTLCIRVTVKIVVGSFCCRQLNLYRLCTFVYSRLQMPRLTSHVYAIEDVSDWPLKVRVILELLKISLNVLSIKWIKGHHKKLIVCKVFSYLLGNWPTPVVQFVGRQLNGNVIRTCA